MPIDLDKTEEIFASSTDLTVGMEEEFAILDPQTLDLVARFEELRDAAETQDTALFEGITGELISSEIEIVSGRGEDLHDAIARQRDRRRRLFALARERGIALGSTGTHPWADYREQRNIDTEHYRRVVEGLGYVARRNNTFSLHVHVGVNGADRAVRVCDRLRPCCRCCSPSAPTRRFWRAGTRCCTPPAARRSRSPSRAAGCPTSSATGAPFGTTSSC